MRDDNDITSLYREFGGDPRNYREIGREDRARAARGRWPLLNRIRPGQSGVPPAAGDSPADRPARAAAWPLAPGAAVAALPLSRFSPVRRGAAVDAAKVAALIHGARVQRPPLDALEIPRQSLREAPPAPAAAPVVAAPVAVEPAAVEPPATEPLAAEPPARPAPKVLIEPTLAPERPAATAPESEPASAATPLQGVFARLARTPRVDAAQDPPSSKAAKK
ncbi:cellulose biosynthesis protein BcsP [Achromobacter sp. EB05]|uniref:cellulose biosynthesis protein BcsP n=1 Tax=Achromobacter sp. EB05 TaxID=3142974 RepID=UPI003784D79C